jgi:hypothetical protein
VADGTEIAATTRRSPVCPICLLVASVGYVEEQARWLHLKDRPWICTVCGEAFLDEEIIWIEYSRGDRLQSRATCRAG